MKRSSPEAQGIASSAVLALVEEAEEKARRTPQRYDITEWQRRSRRLVETLRP